MSIEFPPSGVFVNHALLVEMGRRMETLGARRAFWRQTYGTDQAYRPHDLERLAKLRVGLELLGSAIDKTTQFLAGTATKLTADLAYGAVDAMLGGDEYEGWPDVGRKCDLSRFELGEEKLEEIAEERRKAESTQAKRWWRPFA